MMGLPTPRSPILVVSDQRSCSARVLTCDEETFDLVWLDDPSDITGEVLLRWVSNAALYLVRAERADESRTRSTFTLTGEIERIQRREFFRAPLNASISLLGYDLETEGKVFDISEGGIAVLADPGRELQAQEVITCTFELSQKTFEAGALVIRTDTIVSGKRIALSWLNPTTPMLDTIRKAVFDAQLRPGFRL